MNPTDDIHPSLADRVRAYLGHGAVTLLFDARHPRNRGLAPHMDCHVVRVDLAEEGDSCRLHGDHLAVDYVNQTEAAEAQLPWQAAFFVRGRAAPDRIEAQLLRDRVPACFEPNRLANVERALNQLGLGRNRPSAVEWNIDASPQVVADDGDRSQWCEDKAEAVRRLLSAEGGRAVLLIDTSHGDVIAPPGMPVAPQTEWQVGRGGPWLHVDVGAQSLGWSEQHQNGLLHFEIPWPRLGAVQDAATGQGWYWPADLPQAARDALAQAGEIWTALLRCQGIPLAPPPPPPAEHLKIAGLSLPRPASKLQAMRRIVRLGMSVVLADTRVAGCQLPPQLPGRPWLLMVPLGLPGLDPHVRIDGDGFSAMMPDHDGRICPVRLHWRSVFLLAAAGGLSVCAWEEDYPDELVQALHILRAAQNHTDVAPNSHTIFDRDPHGDGCGMSLEVDAEGKFALHVSQPLSRAAAPPGAPPGAQVRALLELAFALPPPAVH